VNQEHVINNISELAGVSRETVRVILETVGKMWAEELVTKGDVEIENIGYFVLDHREGRRGMDSETHEMFIIPPQDCVLFFPSREMIEGSNPVP